VAEGDTILRSARRIDVALAGEEVRVQAPGARGRAAGVGRLDGRRLIRVEARGKNLLLHFGDLVLHSHLGMNGSWRLYRRGARWDRSRRSAWVVLEGGQWSAAQFGGPTLRVLTRAGIRRDRRLAELGPDILSADFDLGRSLRSLRRGSGETPLGEALLDQRLVAGIGNIFKSEACFAAAVDPRRPLGDLEDSAVGEVLAAARELMLEAVDEGRGKRAVYRRGGMPCPRCRRPVAVVRQGDDARSTYLCPSCQGGGT
jgi:endonuclease-8